MTDSPVSITPAAIAEVKQIIAAKKIPEGYFLRIGIKGGGCGAQLIVGFDEKQEHDTTYEIDGLPFLVDKRHMLYIVGNELDFVEGETQRGFAFEKVN